MQLCYTLILILLKHSIKRKWIFPFWIVLWHHHKIFSSNHHHRSYFNLILLFMLKSAFFKINFERKMNGDKRRLSLQIFAMSPLLLFNSFPIQLDHSINWVTNKSFFSLTASILIFYLLVACLLMLKKMLDDAEGTKNKVKIHWFILFHLTNEGLQKK